MVNQAAVKLGRCLADSPPSDESIYKGGVLRGRRPPVPQCQLQLSKMLKIKMKVLVWEWQTDSSRVWRRRDPKLEFAVSGLEVMI